MTIDELRKHIDAAAWFTRLGSFVPGEGQIAIKSLAAWESDEPIADAQAEKIAEEMEWLPSAIDQPDPIYGNALEARATKLGVEELRRQATLDVYKLVLKSLRSLTPHPLFRVGPHDFTNAAKGAASYAARRAVAEIVIERPDFWCSLIPLYRQGYWPCGYTNDRKLVVL